MLRSIAAVALISMIACPVQAQDPDLIVLTEDENGSQATQGGRLMGISGNGRFAVFKSFSPLVAEDTTGDQIYVRDLETGDLELISATPGGQASSEQQPGVLFDVSNRRAISDDGRYVVFASSSADLVPGIDPGPQVWLFLRDRDTQTTRLVSVDNNDVPGNQSVDGQFTIDPSGVAVAFSSAATNLDPLAPSGGIFLHRTDAPIGSSVRTQAACRDRDGVPRTISACGGFTISCGGAIMAFRGGSFHNWIEGEDLAFGERYADYFIGNPIAGNWNRVGAEADVPLPPDDGDLSNDAGGAPSIDCSGTRIAFWTRNELRLNDTNDPDLYVFDLVARRITLIEDPIGTSLEPPGLAFGQTLNDVSLSSNGNLIAFATQRGIDPNDTNGLSDVYTVEVPRDPIAPFDIQWVSNALGTAGDSHAWQPYASSTGIVAFKSRSDNAPWPVTNFGDGHVFVKGVVLEGVFANGFE